MKYLFSLLILIILQNCSFDNKTGIWNDNDKVIKSKNDLFKDFKKIYSKKNDFKKTINLDDQFKFELTNKIKNSSWTDINYSQSNKLENFSYKDFNQVIFKSKKLTKFKTNKFILYEKNNLIISDIRGNIIVYSINNEEIILKFNFYKKRFKKIEKKLNFLVEKDIIFVSDNLGYFYAINLKTKQVLWANDLKIPLRSNLKIYMNKIFTADQDNNVYFFNKINGNLIKTIPTEKTIIKNHFVNNFSVNNNTLLFLNSYGSLYSFSIENMNLNWFLNLNQSLEMNTRNLFYGTSVVVYKKKVIVSSEYNTFIIDLLTGNILKKYEFSTSLTPIINNNYLFLITKNKFLISIDLTNNQILYSYNILEEIKDIYKINKKNLIFKNLFLVNNKLMVYLKNSIYFVFDINGELKDKVKLTNKPRSELIFINDSLLYLNNRNRLITLN